MKKIYFLVILILISSHLNAQFGYDLFVQQRTFQHLAGGTTMNVQFASDDSTVVLPIGFNFMMAGESSASMNLNFNERGFFWDIDAATASEKTGFAMMEPDINNRADTPGDGIVIPKMVYETTGQPGSRVFTAEIVNKRFFNEFYLYGTRDDSFSVKIILKELDNSIEFHFGPSYINHGVDYFATQNGPFMGFIVNYDQVIDSFDTFYYLTSNESGPDVDSIEDFSSISPALNSMPIAGRVYRFVPSNVGISKIAGLEGVKVINTLCYNTLRINCSKEAVHYQVVSLNGSLSAVNGVLQNGINKIDVGALGAGVYLLRLHNGTQASVVRFVKM